MPMSVTTAQSRAILDAVLGDVRTSHPARNVCEENIAHCIVIPCGMSDKQKVKILKTVRARLSWRPHSFADIRDSSTLQSHIDHILQHSPYRDIKMYTINPTSAHTHTFVFMHSRDSDAPEFVSELFESQTSDHRTFPQIFPHLKWVFPSAKPILSGQFGVEINRWYDMYTTDNPLDQQEKQDLATSVASIQEVLDEEAKFVPYDKIFIGGSSQVCTIAVHALLASPDRPLAGLVGLSSWLPKVEVLKPKVTRDARVLSTPLLLEHNEDDDVIDIQYGRSLRDGLEDMGMQPEWHEYQEGGHWLNEPAGMDAIVAFVQRIIVS